MDEDKDSERCEDEDTDHKDKPEQEVHRGQDWLVSSEEFLESHGIAKIVASIGRHTNQHAL
jgi:hypothetical protein